MTMGDLMQRLTSWKSIRSSRIGVCTDHLLKNNLIKCGVEGNILPGPALKKMASEIHNYRALKSFITHIRQQLDSSSFDPDTLASWLNEILGE